MSMKDLLVHLDVSEKGGNVTDFAISLATEMAAQLTAAGVVIEIIPPSTFIDDFPYDVMQEAADQGTGLGIGLHVVRGLVELHGGSVEARSEGKDRGSEFVVTLPVDQLAEHSGPQSA